MFPPENVTGVTVAQVLVEAEYVPLAQEGDASQRRELAL
jgi:hypothetical protein